VFLLLLLKCSYIIYLYYKSKIPLKFRKNITFDQNNNFARSS